MLRRRTEKAASAAAEAMGGRTARVCDSCLHKRARWFCAADDAFLCQSCDASVHSANQLARRHDRIRLETASSSSSFDKSDQSHLPPWLNGFTRKARTPRPTTTNNNNKQIKADSNSVFSIVPEISNDDGFLIDENHDEHSQLLHHHHQVPVFDPFDDEGLLLTDEFEDFGDGFLPSEVDLAEFVADVENLLGGQEEEEEESDQIRQLLKVKDEDHQLSVEGCMNNNMEDWNYFKGEEIKVEDEDELMKIKKKKKNMFLRLNYDAIIKAWDHQSSPYTTGNRPQLDLDLDDCLDGWFLNQNVENGLGGRGEWKNNGEREARVSRYREKRRTRLFSKKIRYQVRKLNAEKRPRMKGRFVKRTQHQL